MAIQINPSIDAPVIGQTKPIVPPVPTTVPDSTYTAPVADTTATLQATSDASNLDYQNKLKEQQKSAVSYSDLLSQLGGRPADLATAQQSTGTNDALEKYNSYNTQLANINSQAQSLNRAAQAIPIQNQLNAQSSSGTQAGVQSINRDQLSQNALQALSLGQQADIAQIGLNGSLQAYNAAKDKAQKIVDIKYAQIEADIASRKAMLDATKEYTLTPAQEKAKTAAEALVKKQERDIADKKANDLAVGKLLIDASQVAPADILQRAKDIQAKGGSPTEVAMALGKYGGDYLVNEKLKLEMQKVKQSMTTESLQQQKLRGEINAQNPNNPTTGAGSNAKAWLAQYNSGALSLEDIYTKIGSSKEAGVLKNQVAQLVAAQGGKRVYGQDDASIQAINAQVKNIDKLLEGDVGSIVGLVQGGLGVLPDKLNIYKQDALATAKNLVANQTLQALSDAKSKGVTFGALSEGELSLVADSASNIASKLIKDKDGNITGFSGSEAEFKKDLQTIRDGLAKSLSNKTQETFVSTGNPTADQFVKQSIGAFNSANATTPASQAGYTDNQVK